MPAERIRRVLAELLKRYGDSALQKLQEYEGEGDVFQELPELDVVDGKWNDISFISGRKVDIPEADGAEEEEG